MRLRFVQAITVPLLLVGVWAHGVPLPTKTEKSTYVSPTIAWKKGEIWLIAVDLYSSDVSYMASSPSLMNNQHFVPTIEKRLKMRVQVTGSELVNGFDCWQVDYRVVHESLRTPTVGKYRLLIMKQNGVVRHTDAFGGDESWKTRVKIFEPYTYVEYPPYNFPIEFLPFPQSSKISLKNEEDTLSSHLTVQRQSVPHSGGAYVLTSRYEIMRSDLAVTVRREVIVQRWTKGARWWNEYAYFADGNEVLHAVLLTDSEYHRGR